MVRWPAAVALPRSKMVVSCDGRPVITHCFAGKDRTGFAVATVLEAIGVPRDAIMTDFLRSNAAVGRLRDQILKSVRESTETDEEVTFAEARLTDAVLGVREDYLDASKRAIEDNYGSLPAYLESSGVTAEELAHPESFSVKAAPAPASRSRSRR